MQTSRRFPPIGFLILGVLSIAAGVIYVARAVAVEATAERVWSAVILGGLGMMWLIAYAMERQHPAD
jgi:hypothetical protein